MTPKALHKKQNSKTNKNIMHNYKKTQHTTSTEFIQEIDENIHYVKPVETSVLALMQAQGLQDFTPNYSGDIMDHSYKSLMDIKAQSQELNTDIQEMQELITSYKPKEVTQPIAPIAPIDENGQPE